MGTEPVTPWTLLDNLKDDRTRQKAFERLSELYWNTLVVYAKVECLRLKVSDQDPEDVVQDFFIHLMKTRLLEKPERDKSRLFRNWLRQALKYFVLNKTRSAGNPAEINEPPLRRRKLRPLALIDVGSEPYHEDTAEQLSDRQWALDRFTEACVLFKQRFGSDPAYEIYVSRLKDRLTLEALCERHGKTKSQIETILKNLTDGLHAILNSLLRNELETPNDSEVEQEKRKLFALLPKNAEINL